MDNEKKLSLKQKMAPWGAVIVVAVICFMPPYKIGFTYVPWERVQTYSILFFIIFAPIVYYSTVKTIEKNQSSNEKLKREQ
jgi:hypothetical protein